MDAETLIPTMHLRLRAPSVYAPSRLQQGFRRPGDDRLIWRDVPLVIHPKSEGDE